MATRKDTKTNKLEILMALVSAGLERVASPSTKSFILFESNKKRLLGYVISYGRGKGKGGRGRGMRMGGRGVPQVCRFNYAIWHYLASI